MSTRKEKAAKKIKDRNTPVPVKIDKVDSGIKPPKEIDQRIQMRTPEVNAPSIPTTASVQNPTGIPTPNYSEVPDVRSKMPTGAEIQNQTTMPTPTEYVNQQKEKDGASPFSDMLAPFRKAAMKDKTDAVKMQKYYALTDVFNALGKMGGAAVGGAIGGNVLDSAPAVPEYQPSRGYIDAFERAKKANDRLRALDEQEFQLAYNKKQKDEDRAYKAEQDRINKEWQAEQNRINREWQQAVADKDFARQTQLKKDMAALEQKYKKEVLALQAKYADADDKRSLEYLQKQYDLYNAPMPVMFSDGSIVDMTSQQYEQMAKNYIGQKVGGTKITKENFDEVLRANPQAFAGYLKRIGVTPTQVEATEPAEERAEQASPQTDSAESYYYYNPITGQTMKSPVPMPEYEMVEVAKAATPKKKDSKYSVETDPMADLLSKSN